MWLLSHHADIRILSSVLKAMKGPKYHYTKVEMASHGLPKSHSKSTTEPQYEGGGGGVTSSDVAIEEDPAYQSLNVAVVEYQLQPYLPLTCRNLIEQLLCLQYAF